ncbi:MAG TPA: peptidylprolyl isomerase [Chitinophagaceae bacterium]
MLKQTVLLTVVLFTIVFKVNSQPLFTYGNKTVTKQEFLRAFNKNPGLEPNREKALREYLELYINFRLKVQAAYDAKLQNDPNYNYETENFKKQLAANFINDEANIKDLVDEAFSRSQKDIHLQQLFVELPANGDTTAAYQKIGQLYSQLRSGKPFNELAATINPASADLGFVTVFTLPYIYENIVYSLKPGNYAAPVRSSAGYHIFFNAGERKSAGRRKAAQILFATPPGATAEEKAIVRKRADSIRSLIVSGAASFDDMVHRFSNDVTTVDNNGEMQEFGIGQFSPAFEQAAFALKKPGDISQPVETEYGYHLIRLIQVIPTPAKMDDPVMAAAIRERVEKDDRLTEARKMLVSKWIKKIGYKPAKFDEPALWAYTDSFLLGGNTGAIRNVNDSTVVFSFAHQKLTASGFAAYVRAVRVYPMYQSMPFPELMKEYTKAAATEYYQSHLEDYNPDFKSQLKEFNEANLLFAIMDKEVWSRATTDEAGLREQFEANRSKYTWEPSAAAIIFTARDEETLSSLQQRLNGNISNWKQLADSFGNNVMADSNRYELSQIPVVDRTDFKAALSTAPVKNNDGSFTFAYIVSVYPEPGQRSFEEAKGLVITDYQEVLEKRWIGSLKKKYPVKVNQPVFNSLLK